MKAICFFDDTQVEKLQPLTLTRPAGDLRIGLLTIAEKWMHDLKIESHHWLCDNYIAEVFNSPDLSNIIDTCIVINGRYLPTPSFIQKVQELTAFEAINDGDILLAASLPKERIEAFHKKIRTGSSTLNLNFKYSIPDASCINHPWDVFLLNGAEIQHDIDRLKPIRDFIIELPAVVTSINREAIFCEYESQIEPGVTLIAKDGPIYIGPEAHIMAGSIIRGPAAVCEHAVVKMGAKIYGDTTIGPVCKIGGEVNNCVFHSYTNKGHDGFTGNSVFGQWCNLGADTNTSNLKNNYNIIKMVDFNNGTTIDTGQQFIGTIMGDHCKTAINTMLNTGTICGVSSNIFCSGFPPKHIPSFRWLGDTTDTYTFEKAIQTMKKMMKRRDVEITDGYIAMMRTIFEKSVN